MKLKLVDTTLAIDQLRGDPRAAEVLARAVEEEEGVAASELVRFELFAGVRDDELEALEAFFSAISWVPVDEAVSGRRRRSHGSTTDPTVASTTSTT